MPLCYMRKTFAHSGKIYLFLIVYAIIRDIKTNKKSTLEAWIRKVIQSK